MITQKHLFQFAAVSILFVVFMLSSFEAQAKSSQHRSIKHNKVLAIKQPIHKRVYVNNKLTYKKNKTHSQGLKHKMIGLASFYGYESGKRTAMGTRFNPLGLSAAHKTLPLASTVKVTNLRNNKTVTLLINDRGPYIRGRMIDLSLGAARVLGITGVERVSIELI